MHIELVCYGSPIKHKKFVEELNTWKYPIEGNIRKGHARPFVSEVKLYDIRINKEVASEFMRDINSMDFHGNEQHKGWRQKCITMLINLLRKLMGHQHVEKAPGEKRYSLPDWFYVFNVLNIKDPIQTDHLTKEEKEVL